MVLTRRMSRIGAREISGASSMINGLILRGRRVSVNRGARATGEAIGCDSLKLWIILRSSTSMLEFG